MFHRLTLVCIALYAESLDDAYAHLVWLGHRVRAAGAHRQDRSGFDFVRRGHSEDFLEAVDNSLIVPGKPLVAVGDRPTNAAHGIDQRDLVRLAPFCLSGRSSVALEKHIALVGRVQPVIVGGSVSRSATQKQCVVSFTRQRIVLPFAW